jgi:hypothetical protein
MMPPKNQQNRMGDLIAFVNADMLGDIPQHFEDHTIRIERILLEMVRPDPVQPRRVLPERIHFAFHNQQLTPTQALRELVQIAQVSARQNGRPFSNVLELLPDSNDENEEEPQHVKLSPEEILLRDLVNLAVTIRDDGQVNPITVVDVTQGVTRLYRIETGERRYWATWLLRDFIPAYTGDGMIPCYVAPGGSSVFRQAMENAVRTGLNAIGMARQAALLLLLVNGYEIPNYAVTNDFYRQALDLRIPRGTAGRIYTAMGGIDKRRFGQYKDLLKLSDEAMELSDRHQLDERVLRPIVPLAYDDQAEMIRQVIQLNLTSRQLEAIIAQGNDPQREIIDELPSYATNFAKTLLKDLDKQDPDLLWYAVCREQGDAIMAQAYLKRLAQLALNAANRQSDER